MAAFRDHLPDHSVRCESDETSGFYGLQFEGIIAWGLFFLLPEQTQVELFANIAAHLHPEGQFLFTAPSQIAEWQDVLTGRTSRSLGEKKYREILEQHGLEVIATFMDEGENHYFSCTKTS